MDSKRDISASAPSLAEELMGFLKDFPGEFVRCWNELPNKALFFTLLAAWLLLFQFLGNGTFGYTDSSSLFGWMWNSYQDRLDSGEDGHGKWIPFVVLALFWWKRKQLLSAEKRLWSPALLMLAGSLFLHILAYYVQQPLVSIVSLFLGIYSIMGLAWGPAWLRASFFPMFLFTFCVPIAAIGQAITVPLRLFVAKTTALVCGSFLGMNVICEGTQLFNAQHTYAYQVAAACSGLRSLVAILVLSLIYAFVSFEKTWKRAAIIASAIPLAILGNLMRMMCIIITADISGKEKGDFVHENWFFSLLPYVPAIFGLVALGNWLRDPIPETAIQLKPKTI